MTASSLVPVHRPQKPFHPIALACSLLAVVGVAAVGRLWTDTDEGSWYAGLDKPAWTPPGATFGIVWSVLYLLMGAAAWEVFRSGPARTEVRQALVLYAIQLALNLGWSAVFFAAERPGWAVVEIVILLGALVATIAAFRRVSAIAALLLVPYLVWVAYATTLTIGIAVLN